MRAVLDTNVLARAVPGSAGPARRVLESLLEFPHVLVTAPPLLEELARVLAYPRLRAIHGLDDAALLQFVHDVERASFVVDATTAVTAIQSDPDDNAVIAAAIGGQAEVICTLDRHFRSQDVLDFCSQHGIRILNDIELLNEIPPTVDETTST